MRDFFLLGSQVDG
jgi:hypothetical protein